MNLEPIFRNMVTDGNSICRLLHYPATSILIRNILCELQAAQTLICSPAGWRNGSGLELQIRKATGNRLSAAKMNVLDTGDMMARLTNDVLPATVHRVINPINQNAPAIPFPSFSTLTARRVLNACHNVSARMVEIPTDHRR